MSHPQPNMKRASQWLMNPVALERRLSLVWQDDQPLEEEEERTAWWLLWCMGRYLGCQEVATKQQERIMHQRISRDPEQWFLDHVITYGHRYFRYDDTTDTLRVLRSAIPPRDQDWYPSYPQGPEQWLTVTKRVREHSSSLALLMLRLWRQQHDEYVRQDRWDLVKNSPDLQQMALRLIPVDPGASTVWTKLPACAMRLQAKELPETNIQLTIMLKKAGVAEEVAKELVGVKIVSELYAKETHCWSCHTMQKRGYCPHVVPDMEDLTAAKCLADYVVVTKGKKKKLSDQIGISPEAFIQGTVGS